MPFRVRGMGLQSRSVTEMGVLGHGWGLRI